MSKRTRRRGASVSLFPFLSILACVIGVLTFMITAMAVGQLDRTAIARAEQYQKLHDQAKADRAEMNRLEGLLAAVDAVHRQLAQARAELKDLASKRAAVTAAQAARAQLAAEAGQLRDALPALQTKLRQLEANVAQKRAELSKRDGPPPDAMVKVQPGGSGVDLAPTFVECDAAGVVIHQGGQRQRIARGKLRTDATFLGLLDRIADTKNGTVVFLLRSDGVGTYRAASALARAHYCRNGKLPVPGRGPIDLSLFRQAP